MSQTEPNNKEAEEKLIACCCIDGTPDVFNSISNIITEDDFYYLKTKLLFKSVQHLVNSSTPIDSISIMEYLKSIECLDEVDGVYGIEEIVGSTTSSMQVKYLANVVLDKSKLRSSTGIGLNVLTPIGPLSFSLSQPITKASSDKTESFRFNLGTTF